MRSPLGDRGGTSCLVVRCAERGAGRDPTNSFTLGQDVMRLQHVVQHEGQAGHKDAMFKMTRRPTTEPGQPQY
jgi:hypothetical protein